jgi:hypothetical protein
MYNFFGINHIAKSFNLLLMSLNWNVDPVYTSHCRRCKDNYGAIRPHIRRTGRPYQFKHHIHHDLESVIEDKLSPSSSPMSSYLFCDACWKWVLKKMKGLPLELVPTPVVSCEVCGLSDCLGMYSIPLWRGKYVRSGFYSLWLCRSCHLIGKRLGALPYGAYLYCGNGSDNYIWHANAKLTIRIESRYRRQITLLAVFTAARRHKQGPIHQHQVPVDILKLVVKLV